MNLSYCDYIANTLSYALAEDAALNPQTYIAEKDGPKLDLHPEYGYFLSTKKVIGVTDINGKKYKITIEEAN